MDNAISLLRLREDVILEIRGSSAHFMGTQTFAMNNLDEAELAVVRCLRSGSLRDDSLDTPRKKRIVALLAAQGVLRSGLGATADPGFFHRQLEWMSHFGNTPEETLANLKTKTVAIIGCGGTGAIIAMHLARSGIGRFVLVDGGRVDLPDLNRQLTYFAEHVGQEKASVLSRYLEATHGEIVAIGIAVQIGEVEQLRAILAEHRPALVINCADTPPGMINSIVAEAARDTGTTALFGAVGLEEASVGPLLTSAQAKTAFAADMRNAHERFLRENTLLKSSICFTNTIAATMIAFEAFKYVTGLVACHVENRSVVFDFGSNEFRVEKEWP